MRLGSLLISIFLHASVVLMLVFWTSSQHVRIRLDMPVYEVELVDLQKLTTGPQKSVPASTQAPAAKPEPAPEAKPVPAPKPEPKTAPAVEPKAEPKPEPKPKPQVKPAPPKPQDISKKDTAKPKVKKRPEPTPEQVMAEALKSVQKDVAKKDKTEKQTAQSAYNKELAALRSQVAKENAATGGDVQASGAVQVYARMIEQLIKQNWRYPSVNLSANLACSVEMTLGSDGTITAARLVRSSGRPDFDGSALRAVNETEKVPPPPGGAFKTIEINFNLQDLVQ